MKLTTRIAVFLPLIVFCTAKGQNYGENLYQHSAGGTKMCQALTIEQHTVNPGYLMLGYKSQSPPNTYNFAIDRTALGGACNGQPGTFQRLYQMHADVTEECSYNVRPVLNCSGVSVIETMGIIVPQRPTAAYALAGAFGEGCFFGLLDAGGNCFFSTSFIFPARNYTTITQPKIIECTQYPGEYIICGGIDRTMYALRVNSFGSIIWSHFYPIDGEPKDMIAAAFGPNKHDEFVVVGKSYIDFLNNETDGFLMMLNQSTGNVVISRRVHISTVLPNQAGDQYFNTITVMHKEYPFNNNYVYTNEYGYLVGGYCEPFSHATTGRAWYYRCDSTLWAQATDVFTPQFDTTSGGEIVDFVARKTISLNKYNYYALLKTNAGMDVIRTQDVGPGNHPAPVFREFLYNIPNQISESCSIGMINDINSPYAGLQIFGTDNSSGPGSHYLVKAYFSGESSCNNSTATPAYLNSSSTHFIDNITPYGGLSSCQSFYITSSEEQTFYTLCGPDESLSGGSNLRNSSPFKNDLPTTKNKIGVFPNPTTGKTTVEYNLEVNGPVQIGLYNILGQRISLIEENRKDAGNYRAEIDFQALGLKNGVYLLRYELPGKTETLKLIFEGN